MVLKRFIQVFSDNNKWTLYSHLFGYSIDPIRSERESKTLKGTSFSLLSKIFSFFRLRKSHLLALFRTQWLGQWMSGRKKSSSRIHGKSLKGLFLKIFILMWVPHYVWLCWLHKFVRLLFGLGERLSRLCCGSTFLTNKWIRKPNENTTWHLMPKKTISRVFGEATRSVSFINRVCFLAAFMSRALLLLLFRIHGRIFFTHLIWWCFIAFIAFRV